MPDRTSGLSTEATKATEAKPKKNWLGVLSNALSGATEFSKEYIGTARQPDPDIPIEKPFYQKGWFIGTCVGVVVLVLVYFLFIRKKKAS